MKLNDSELKFLQSQRLKPTDVFDGRQLTKAQCRENAKQLGKTLVLGVPCKRSNHRLRTRSGMCAQCNPATIAYQNRHNTPAYVYIAGSKRTKLIKVGTATDIRQRERNLNNHAYGGTSDWRMLFYAKAQRGGEVEREIQSALAHKSESRIYWKDGREQKAGELFLVSFSVALSAVYQLAADGEIHLTDHWMRANHNEFDGS